MNNTQVLPEIAKKDNKKSQPGKTLLVIFGILLVISLLLTLIGFNIYRVLFNPTQVKELLFSEVKNSNLVPAVFEYFSVERAKSRIEKGEALSGVSEPDIPLLISFLEMEDWRKIKNLLVDDEFITHLVSVSVDGTYAWIDSPDMYPQIVWRMSPLRTAMTGDPGKNSILVGYEALPDCTQEQLDDFTSRLAASPPGVEVLYNLCRFPAPLKDDQIDDYIHSLVDVNNNIPTEFSFSQMLKENNTSASMMTRLIKSLLKTIRWFGRWGWIVTLVIIGVIFLFGFRQIRQLLKWFGVPFVVSGCVLLIIYLLGLGLWNKWLTTLLLSQTSDVVRREVAASLTHLSSSINTPLLIEGLLILAIGIGLLVVNGVLVKKAIAKS